MFNDAFFVALGFVIFVLLLGYLGVHKTLVKTLDQRNQRIHVPAIPVGLGLAGQFLGHLRPRCRFRTENNRDATLPFNCYWRGFWS